MNTDDRALADLIAQIIIDRVRLEVRPGCARMDGDSVTDAARAIVDRLEAFHAKPVAGEVIEVQRGSANSHVFDDIILSDGEAVAFASEPWTARIAAALQSPLPVVSGEAVGCVPLEQRVREVMGEGDGFWRACSGCQESVDGCVSTKDYPYSTVFKCQPGGGCGECGGIGVIWDTTDYGDMARFMLEQDRIDTPPVVEEGQREADELEYEFEMDGDEFALSWPDGRWLVAHGTGKIQFGISPRDPAVPIRTMHLDAILALTPVEGVGKGLGDFRCHNCKRVIQNVAVAPERCPDCRCRDFSACAPSTPVAAQGDGWSPIEEFEGEPGTWDVWTVYLDDHGKPTGTLHQSAKFVLRETFVNGGWYDFGGNPLEWQSDQIEEGCVNAPSRQVTHFRPVPQEPAALATLGAPHEG